MNDAAVLDVVGGALIVATKLAGPILVVSLVVGVVIALFQTVTQIQEMTLTFVPKLVATAVVILVGGNWMIQQLVGWVRELWGTIPHL